MKNKIDKEVEIVAARLIMMEQELKDWWCPSIRHLKSIVTIFEGYEYLKTNITIIDQLFKIYLVIDSKKDCLQTIEHWFYYEKFLNTLLQNELFNLTYKPEVIDTIQNRVYAIQAFIKQEQFQDLLPVDSMGDGTINSSGHIDSLKINLVSNIESTEVLKKDEIMNI